jgi:protein involved in polysaccharide export with SLBB domain
MPCFRSHLKLHGAPNEQLQDALGFAGGFTEIAYRDVVEVLRYGQQEKEVFSVRAADLGGFALKLRGC